MCRYIQSKQVVQSKIDEEVVMMDIESGFYFGLNSVASVIWELLKDGKTVDELADYLITEYDVNREQCLEETDILIKKMLDLKVIRCLEDK
jgi:hypothetical protein